MQADPLSAEAGYRVVQKNSLMQPGDLPDPSRSAGAAIRRPAVRGQDSRPPVIPPAAIML